MSTKIKNIGYTPHDPSARYIPLKNIKIEISGKGGGTRYPEAKGIVFTTLNEMQQRFGTTDGREALTPNRNQKLLYSNDRQRISGDLHVGKGGGTVTIRIADIADSSNTHGADIWANGVHLNIPWKGVDGGGSGPKNIDTIVMTTTEPDIHLVVDVGANSVDGWTAEEACHG